MTRTASNTTLHQDAIAILMSDHKNVKQMFKDFESMGDDDDMDKSGLVAQICQALTAHMQLEEELFYPAARKALGKDDDDLLDEADIEHNGAKELIAQLEGMTPSDDHYDAKVTVLGEYIEHHVKEEETSMFPKLKKTGLDTASLGAKMAKRRETLMEQGAAPPKAPPPRRNTQRAHHASK